MSTLTLEVVAPFTVQQNGQVTTWHPGYRVTLSQEKAQRVLACVGNKVRVLEGKLRNSHSDYGPTAPLLVGWLVAYRDEDHHLRGGCDDRLHGTVQDCAWDGTAFRVLLTDGQRLPLSSILSVGRTDSTGQIVSAWTVREHGYDGEGIHRGDFDEK